MYVMMGNGVNWKSHYEDVSMRRKMMRQSYSVIIASEVCVSKKMKKRGNCSS